MVIESMERIERVGHLCAKVFAPLASSPRGALVLVHGLCMSGWVWHRWAELFVARGLEVWCVDLRGHGQSDGVENIGQMRIEDYASDVEAILAHSGAQVLLGHDMGGLVAQMVATRQELRGMVLVGTIAPKGVSGRSNVSRLWRELRPRYIRALLRGQSWRPAEADVLHTLCGKLSPDDRHQVLSWIHAESGVAARQMVLSGVAVDETQVRCPVLVVASTFDQLTTPQRQRLIAARYRADYVEFAQHAHFLMLEPGFERPAAVIGKWLEGAARLGEHHRSSSSIRIATQHLVARTASGSPSITPLPMASVTALPDGMLTPSSAPPLPSSNGGARRSSHPPADTMPFALGVDGKASRRQEGA